MAEFLEDMLWLPFQEPLILQHGEPVSSHGPDFSREAKADNALPLGTQMDCLHFFIRCPLMDLHAGSSMHTRMLPPIGR